MSVIRSKSNYSLCFYALLGLGGCKDLTGSTTLPANTPDPAFYHTASGAIGMYTATIEQVQGALPQYILDAGLLTDEVSDRQTNASAGTLLQTNSVTDPLDERIFPADVTVQSYSQLQGIRTLANQAIGALTTYDTTVTDTATSKVRRSELYSLEGYAEVMLADLFCSGVPLSTLDFQKDFTYAPGLTTTEVYQDALTKFDTALTLSDTSTQLRYLARVGQGRAYLDLGLYAAAADDVTIVPDTFQFTYQIPFNGDITGGKGDYWNGTVSDLEGSNGLPYRSSGDPRTAATLVSDVLLDPSTSQYGTAYFPTKYIASLNGSGLTPFVFASGVEAQLIQAEAAFHGVTTGRGSWIDQLNDLRTAYGMTRISDPGDPKAQVDTLFTERAAWLFLTGHRQGDLRRLLRQYGQYFQSQAQVYPTGQYLAPGTGRYGTEVVAPIPPAEAANPLFQGCLSDEP